MITGDLLNLILVNLFSFPCRSVSHQCFDHRILLWDLMTICLLLTLGLVEQTAHVC